MDPNITLRELTVALSCGRAGESLEAARALDEWLAKGGFCPTVSGAALRVVLRHIIGGFYQEAAMRENLTQATANAIRAAIIEAGAVPVGDGAMADCFEIDPARAEAFAELAAGEPVDPATFYPEA